MKIHSVIIDPQKDFCDPTGSLYVEGANDDMVRLSDMLIRLSSRIDAISVTLDSHHHFDVAHGVFWVNSEGNHPDPFTGITYDNVQKGVWKASNPQLQQHALDYTRQLEENGRYPMVVWPDHCLIGSNGYAVHDLVFDALLAWEKRRIGAMVDWVTKGSNWKTEHYSAVQADVPDPEDPTTMLNTQPGSLIDSLTKADFITLSGEALSHCLANTVRDIADTFGEDNIKKMVLIEDTTSSVAGFENLGTDFVAEMKGRGMATAKSTEFLA